MRAADLTPGMTVAIGKNRKPRMATVLGVGRWAKTPDERWVKSDRLEARPGALILKAAWTDYTAEDMRRQQNEAALHLPLGPAGVPRAVSEVIALNTIRCSWADWCVIDAEQRKAKARRAAAEQAIRKELDRDAVMLHDLLGVRVDTTQQSVRITLDELRKLTVVDGHLVALQDVPL